jgi:putative ubiquitin-RnfH superfamily antitoxin RatB of RatAB toxin-antitoxin module
VDITNLEPTIKEIDSVLIYLRELLIDPKLNERRRILILKEIDDLLDDRLQTSRPS